MREKLPSVTYPATNISAFFWPQSLREVELGSTFHNVSRKAVGRNFSSVAQCNMFLATCVAMFCDISQ